MAHYSYWVRRYSKKSRRQVFLTAIGMVTILVGIVVVLQKSETERERDARAQSEFTGRVIQRSTLMKQQDEYLQNACLDGKDACDKAEAEIQQENCQLLRESCPRNLK
jgi:hypothetical protein